MAEDNGDSSGRESTERRQRSSGGRALTEYCGMACWFVSWICVVSAFCLFGLAVLTRDGRAAAGGVGAMLLHLILLSIAQIISSLTRIEDRLGK